MARRPIRLTPASLAMLAAVTSLLACAGPTTPSPPSDTTTSNVATPVGGTPMSTGTPQPTPAPTTTPPRRATSQHSSAPTPSTSSSSRPPRTTFTADDVALRAVTAWLSWDTRIDHRPNDTARRLALPWLTSDLREQVTKVAGDPAPGADWNDWTRRHAHANVTAELSGDDHPPDSPRAAFRQITATITLRGDDAWTATQQRTVYLELVQIGTGWFVAQITTSGTT